jgi:myo-inositol-1(or 4)-monophosphatase
MTDETHRAAVAERAARAGGAVAREQFRGDLDVETKANKNDLVSDADRAAQQQVLSTIQAEFPEDEFVCEEDVVPLVGPERGTASPTLAEEVPDTGACWVIDPIDGTANFVRGLPTWATSVAAVVDGEPVGAVSYMPAMGDLYAAGPESVTRDGDAMRVSDRSDPETAAAVAVGWWALGEREEFFALCTAIGARFGDLRRIGSFQASLAAVADGSLDVAICTTPTLPWDTIAGVHLIRRAGGTVTDLDGEPWSHGSRGVVASNGAVHEEALAAAQEARR